jgi:hypothetical protein
VCSLAIQSRWVNQIVQYARVQHDRAHQHDDHGATHAQIKQVGTTRPALRRTGRRTSWRRRSVVSGAVVTAVPAVVVAGLRLPLSTVVVAGLRLRCRPWSSPASGSPAVPHMARGVVGAVLPVVTPVVVARLGLAATVRDVDVGG